MKKAIVTGASGFIGKFLVKELLNNDVEVIAVVRKNSRSIKFIEDLSVNIIQCEASDYCTLPKQIKDRDIDAVFHMAWQGVSDSDAKNPNIQLGNIRSTLELIDDMNLMGVKTFVGAGSMHEAESFLEMAQDKVITNEGYMYKAAKLSAHWMGKAKAGSYGMRFFWPLITAYGEGESSSRLINTVIRKLINDEVPELSTGTQCYDFVYVTDVAKALLSIAERGKNGTNYFIGSGCAAPLKDFLNTINRVVSELRGKQGILKFGQIESNGVSLPKEFFDITKLTKDTGFKPKVSFSDGVYRTAKWILNGDKI